MAVFELQHPDGKAYEVDAPSIDAATQALGQHDGNQPAKRGGLGGVWDEIKDRFNNPSNELSLIGIAGEAWRGLESAAKLGSEAVAGKLDPNSPEAIEDTARASSLFLPASPAAGSGRAIARIAEGRPAATPRPIPPRPQPGPFGVTLSEGQATGDLPKIQVEQAALRGTSGPAAEARAKLFADQQQEQLKRARDQIARSLDPFGANVAETPQQAGAIVSESIGKAAKSAKAGVDLAYKEAREYPGEIHAGAFEGIGQKIKGDLSLRPDPVIIDDQLTPHAARAIKDIDERVSQLKIQNRADPFGQPNQENIAGVSLKGVDQMRKRLSAFRQGAFGSGNASDGRAAKAVLDAFDDQIDAAVKAGLFRGDPRAVQAWLTARAAHADYRATFGAQKGDPVGRVVEKILGNRTNDPAIPNDVADFIYGGSGVNPSSLNVGVAKRVKHILGDRSPEWSAVKQGLFHRLVDSGEGATPFGPGKVAQRLAKFLRADGAELAGTVFSSQERALLWRYAQLMRKLEVPQAGANWSNTATFMARHMQKVGGNMGMLIAAAIARTIAPMLPFVAEGVGAGLAKLTGKAAGALQARQVAKQMPLVGEQIAAWQKASARQAVRPSPSTQRAALFAWENLMRSLRQMGVDVSSIQAGGVGRAQDDQQDVQRPPRQ